MPVKQIELKDAKPRMKVRGSISSNNDYSEVIRLIPSLMQTGKPIEVELDLNQFPEVKADKKQIPFLFCASLRRWFANNGIPAECYKSSANIVTIKKAAHAPKKPVPKR